MANFSIYFCIQVLVFSFRTVGGEESLTVVEGKLLDGAFRCNTTVKLRCFVKPKSNRVRWTIGKPIDANTSLDADCLQSLGICTPSSRYPARYKYTYDGGTGESDVILTPTLIEDDKMEFICTNGSVNSSYKAKVKVPPAFESTNVSATTSYTNSTDVNVQTDCIYPSDEVRFTWFSNTTDGNDVIVHASHDPIRITCTKNSDCITSSGSAVLSTSLRINTTDNGQERNFYVNVTFGSVLYCVPIGAFNVTNEDFSYKETTDTGCTNTTTKSITIPTNNNSRTTHSTFFPVLNNTRHPTFTPETTDAHKDYFVIIAVSSSLVGVGVLLFVFFAIRKCRQKHSKRSTQLTVTQLTSNL